MPTSISANYSQTNGERKYVDDPTTFIIGEGSNLKVGKVENTASAIGTSGNGKLSIDEYVGHNLENVDKSKTVGGSVGISTSGINSIGINYNDRKQEGITKNTVVGNVEIGKSSGAEINKDLDSMTEVTKDRKFETNINIESQTIKYALNPEAFKQDLKKAKNEIEDIGNVVKNTVNPLGEDSRNFFKNLRAQRWDTSFYNVTGSRMEELSRQFKAGEINENQLKEAARDLIKSYGKDIGIDYEVVYLDEETMPKDSKGSTGDIVIDENGKKTAISTKSLDLTSKSYTSKEYKNQMYYNIKGYIDDIDNFEQARTGEDVLTKQMISKNVLEISINEHELTKQQIDNIKRSMDYAKEKKVELKFIIEK